MDRTVLRPFICYLKTNGLFELPWLEGQSETNYKRYKKSSYLAQRESKGYSILNQILLTIFKYEYITLLMAFSQYYGYGF